MLISSATIMTVRPKELKVGDLILYSQHIAKIVDIMPWDGRAKPVDFLRIDVSTDFDGSILWNVKEKPFFYKVTDYVGIKEVIVQLPNGDIEPALEPIFPNGPAAIWAEIKDIKDRLVLVEEELH